MERTQAKTVWRQDEIKPPYLNGFIGVFGLLVLLLLEIVGMIMVINALASGDLGSGAGVALILLISLLATITLIAFAGLKVVQPNEALVLTLFGQYHGTLRQEGFYIVNPFVAAFNPAAEPGEGALELSVEEGAKIKTKRSRGKKMSLKVMTLNNGQQKINDAMGNPIIIGIVVIWRVENTVKAAFNVDNYIDFLSTQTDSALRNITRLYPYDGFEAETEKSLQGSSQEVAQRIKEEIQSKVDIAGLDIIEARITHLAYAPEIASAMLQRQQARAIIDARAMIVDGAVGMVEMALQELDKSDMVILDDERKAAMISNLLVVLCGNHDVHPVVNSGSIY